MAIQLSPECRNAGLDAYETATGPSPIATIRTGAVPANTAAANAGTVLATLSLPADWMSAAAGGIKTLLGSWGTLTASATGTAAHFRIHNTAGTVCHWQGTVGLAGSGADMTVDFATVTAAQPFNVTQFTLTAPNA